MHRVLYNLVTGFSIGVNSGLVYGFLITTSTAYFKDNGLSLALIGFLSARMLPYSFKYFWAPFLDNYKISVLSIYFCQRKGWMLIMQTLLIILISSFGFIDVVKNTNIAFAILLLIAFAGSTYDIALQAYRIELFKGKEEGIGNSSVVYGFKVGIALSGVLGLLLTTILSWKYVFIVLSLLIIPCMIIISFSESTLIIKQYKSINVRWFKDYFAKPFGILIKKKNFFIVFCIVFFYKVSDAYLDTMSIPFLMDMGFLKAEIASVAKISSMIGVILGTFIGGAFVSRFSFFYTLIYSELLASLTNLQFMILTFIEKNLIILGVMNFVESFSFGISNIVLLSYMSKLCDRNFNATHFAILNSISALGRALLSTTSGIVAQTLGWNMFFVVSSLFSLPSIFCIYMLYCKDKNGK